MELFVMFRKSFFVALLSVSLFGTTALAQPFSFHKIIDSESTELGDSYINGVVCAPAIEGDYVVFRTQNRTSNVSDAIWSYHIPSGTFTKLVGVGTPVPGGVGNFTDLATGGSSLGGPVLKDGVVVFGGADEGTNPSGFGPVGVYSVPVTGGAISKIANYETAAPDTPTNFFYFGEDSRNFGSVSHKNGVVVFEGIFGGGPIGGTGLYNAPVTGGNIQVVGDSNHPWNPLEPISPVQNFSNPATNGLGVALIGGTVFGHFGVFYSPLPSSGATGFSLLVGPETPLPGSTAPNNDTRLFNPSVQIDGERVGFIARDISSNTVGVYATNVIGSAIEAIVTNKTALDNITTFPDSSINPFSYAMDGTSTLFRAYPSHNEQGLYLKEGASAVTQVVDTSFSIDGIPLYDFSEITPYALNDGRFVFAYTTITFPRSVLVIAGPEGSITPGDEGSSGDDVTAQVTGLVASAQAQLSTAKRKLPKGKSKAALRQAIKDARTLIKTLVNSLFEIAKSEGTSVLSLNVKRAKALKKAVRAGSRAKASNRVRVSSWKKVAKVLKQVVR